MRPAPRVAALVLLACLLLPVASAQTLTNPVIGKYEQIYMVAGRAIDGAGGPIAGGRLVVEIEQPGVRGEPVTVGTNCYGDFIATFNLAQVDPTGKAHVRLQGAAGGVSDARAEVALDPFYRRSDLTIQSDGVWNKECPEESRHWPGRLTVTGRVVNRTEPYEAYGATHHAKPYEGAIDIWFYDADGYAYCPPHAMGGCERIATDERGDFRYSFTFPDALPSQGSMAVKIGEQWYNATLDPEGRIAVHRIELSGRGAPELETPAPALWASLLGIVAVAGLRSVLHRHRR